MAAVGTREQAHRRHARCRPSSMKRSPCSGCGTRIANALLTKTTENETHANATQTHDHATLTARTLTPRSLTRHALSSNACLRGTQRLPGRDTLYALTRTHTRTQKRRLRRRAPQRASWFDGHHRSGPTATSHADDGVVVATSCSRRRSSNAHPFGRGLRCTAVDAVTSIRMSDVRCADSPLSPSER